MAPRASASGPAAPRAPAIEPSETIEPRAPRAALAVARPPSAPIVRPQANGFSPRLLAYALVFAGLAYFALRMFVM